MPALTDYPSEAIVKVLYLGDSGVGKTGSLVSLVAAGYKLKIIDFDNGLPVLKSFIEKECPEKLSSVEYEALRDKYTATPLGPKVQGVPKAYVETNKLLDKWPSTGTPLESLGPEHIVVIDSLTGLGNAAFNWARGLNPSVKDERQWYRTAQNAVDMILQSVNAVSFNTNVIVTAHIKMQEDATGLIRAYPNSIGSAYNPFIASNFNNMVLALKEGSGKNIKRKIVTAPTALLDLKSSAPFRVSESYDLSTGLATLFEQLKGK